MKNGVVQKIISVAFALSLALFILSFSIAIPIFCRSVYYAHIEPLELEQTSGYTAEQIRQSYDEVMDYLTKPDAEFSVGDMAYTYRGVEHFKEVKLLFNLNNTICGCSAICIVIILLLRLTRRVTDLKLGKHSALFYGGVAALSISALVGLAAAIDFESAFIIFHKIFFPNNQYWILDPTADEIVGVLPEAFFMNCAIIIGGSVVILSSVAIVTDLIKKKKSS